jgi:hypothetical protein
MPAIQPARLKIQVAELSRAFQQPEILVKQLHEILGLYTDRTHKPGLSGEPRPLMQAYNVPQPVIRQIMTEMKPIVLANKEDALKLSDLLWKQPYWEMRSLAASILGQVIAEDYTPILDKLTGWLAEELEDQMIDVILENATTQLRSRQVDLLLNWSKSYLSSEKKFDPNIAVRLLTVLVRENDLENLPAIFKLINPHLRKIPQALRQDVVELVSVLARRSPGETAYILRTNLSNETTSDAAWIIRQVMNSFPTNHQDSLRAAMRAQESI